MLNLKIYIVHACYLFTSHFNTSATSGKFGFLKFSMEINRGYPSALVISVKSENAWAIIN